LTQVSESVYSGTNRAQSAESVESRASCWNAVAKGGRMGRCESVAKMSHRTNQEQRTNHESGTNQEHSKIWPDPLQWKYGTPSSGN